MLKYRKWVLTLGIMAATPGIASAANPFDKIFKGKPAPKRTATAPASPAKGPNQQVAEAIATVRPYAVDICSGLRRDGALAPDRVDDFFAAVRRAD